MPTKIIKNNIPVSSDGGAMSIAPAPVTNSGKKSYLNIFHSDEGHLKPLFLSFFLILAMYFIGSNWDRLSQNNKRFVTVSGQSSSLVSNEIAVFSANVMVTNEVKEVAISEANDKIKKIVDAIKAYDVEDKDIKTRNVNVFQMEEPYMENGVQKYAPGDWRAYIGVDITYRDAESVGLFADMLSRQDLTDMSGPNFQMDTSKYDDSELLKSALEDAKSKAKFLAVVSGGKLGRVVNIVEYGVPDYGVVTMYDKGMGGGGGIPVEPGSTERTKSLTVTYELIVR